MSDIDYTRDYRTLVQDGSVIYRGEGGDEWRGEMRRRARADRLKIRTGTTPQGAAYAVLPNHSGELDAERLGEIIDGAFGDGR